MSAKHAAAGSQTSRSSYSSSSKGYRSSYSGRQPRRPHKKHTARNVIITILIIVAIVVVCGVSFALSARAAMGDAMTLQSNLSTYRTQISDGDTDAAKETVQNMGTAASDMHSQTSGPVWKIATIVPVYGSDIQKVIDLASVSDSLVNGALVPLTQKSVSFNLSGFVKKDGSFNLKKLEPTIEALAQANSAIQSSNNTISSMGESNISQLNKPIETLKEVLPELASTSRMASTMSPVIGDLLGGNGERTYLLVAQNNVEIRSTGGFPGSMGTVTVKNGEVSLGSFKSIYDWMPKLSKDNAVNVTDEERRIFTDRLNRYPSRVGQIPDFSRVSTIWNEYWKKDNGSQLDGIIAVDPVFLQNVLKLTGGFTASNGWKVDGSNAAETLMNRSYREMAIDDTDAFFSEVASKAFQKLKDRMGSIDTTKLADTINDGIQDRRMLVWMADSEEESAMEELGCAGEISNDITDPVLGVYLDDYAWSKFSWYLDEDVSVTKDSDNLDGSKTYSVKVTLKNTMTDAQKKQVEDAVDDAGRTYIFGNREYKRSETDMIYLLYLTAPAGGSISDVKTTGYFGSYSQISENTGPINGKKNDKTMARTTYNGQEIWAGATQIEQGQETTVSFKVTTATGTNGDLQVDQTPTANPNTKWDVTYKE